MSYTFNWSEGNCAVVWGYGSLYNHGNGELSCASYRMQLKIPCVEYFAKRVIEPGEEILIHYLRGKGDVEFCDDGTWLQSDGVVDKVPFRRSSAGGRLTALDADWHDSN